MKNAFKFGFLALSITLTAAACSSEKSAESTDTTMMDSTMMTDTMAKPMDTMMTDTMMKDTTKM